MVYSKPKTTEELGIELFQERKKGSKAPLTQPQLDFIYENHKKGQTPKQISKLCLDRVGVRTIQTRIANDDWVSRRSGGSVTNLELLQMKQDAETLSLEEIAAKYRISLESVTRYRDKGWSRAKRPTKYSFNEKFFDNVDNEKTAYWLGFLAADGYILSKRERKDRISNEQQSFGMNLSINDSNHLENFKKDLEANHPINIYENKGTYGGGKMGRILLTSQYTVEKLKKLGIEENKTFSLKFPLEETVPPHLIHHWIRGYFDGDGSISCYEKEKKYNLSFCGTKEVLTGIQAFFGTSVSLEKRYPERDSNTYALRYCGNRQIERIGEILYQDATRYLERKHDRFLELKLWNSK